jgi:gliding motility-associated lipoprotein GldH
LHKAIIVNKSAICIAIILYSMSFVSCASHGVMEQTTAIPGHAWSGDMVPECSFDITDTTSLHRLFFVIRHTDAYEFNNIWIVAESMSPGDTAFSSQRFDLPLSRGDRWSGSAMDDIREHRILMYREPVRFRRTGRYRVKLHHQMRQDPLRHVMNVGFRIERTNR